MEQTNMNAPMAPARPGFLSVLCILSMIGSGVLALCSLLGIFASGMVMSWFGGKMSEATSSPEMANADSATKASMQAGADAATGFAAMGTGILITFFVIGLLFFALKFFGALQMWKLKKGGFWMYLVPAVILAGLYFYSHAWLAGGVSILFIGGFAANMKALR